MAAWYSKRILSRLARPPLICRLSSCCAAISILLAKRTNVVGARPGVDVHVVEEKLSGGDQLLLTTDGVHGVLDGDQLLRFVESHESGISNLADALVHAALDHGSRDNCTAVVLTL